MGRKLDGVRQALLTIIVSKLAVNAKRYTGNSGRGCTGRNTGGKSSVSVPAYFLIMISATQDGVYNEGDVRATGSVDTALEDTLADYVIEGVEFTYLRVGDIEQYSITTGTGTQLNLVYEIPGELAAILGLADEDGYQISLTENRDGTISGYSVSKTVQLDDSLKATDMDRLLLWYRPDQGIHRHGRQFQRC